MNKTEVTLGIDIGGTNTVFGFVDNTGNCLYSRSIPTNSDQSAEILFTQIFNIADEIKKDKNIKILGVGIGAPNANYYKGTIENPANLGWHFIDVESLIRKSIDVPMVITNDANAAAIGEMEFGNARGMKNFVEITLGTGLGSAFIVNGELVYGQDSFAGELGHIIVKEDGRQCSCGAFGCLETYASANGLVRNCLEILAVMNIDSDLRKISPADLSSKTIYEAAMKDDNIALETFEYTGKILGEALALVVTIFSPEAIILFGGVAAAGDLIIKPAKFHMEKNVYSAFRNKVKILPSGLPHSDAAVLGAAALIWHKLREK